MRRVRDKDEVAIIRIPEKFSRATMRAMNKKMVTHSARIEIVTAVVYQLFATTEYPTKREYDSVCKALITRYLVLKDTIGNGFVSSSHDLQTEKKLTYT